MVTSILILIGLSFLASVEGAWTPCATENQICNFNGTKIIRYGNEGKYFYTEATNSIKCENNAFQGDPIPNTIKKCDYIECMWNFKFCSKEGEVCQNPYYTDVIVKMTNGYQNSYNLINYARTMNCTHSNFRFLLKENTTKTCMVCPIYVWGMYNTSNL